MEHAIHVISGLPRAGSTLLATILRQNPAFHAAMTCTRVHGRVKWRLRPSVLPPDLFERFANDSFWRKPQPRLAHVVAILQRGGG